MQSTWTLPRPASSVTIDASRKQRVMTRRNIHKVGQVGQQPAAASDHTRMLKTRVEALPDDDGQQAWEKELEIIVEKEDFNKFNNFNKEDNNNKFAAAASFISIRPKKKIIIVNERDELLDVYVYEQHVDVRWKDFTVKFNINLPTGGGLELGLQREFLRFATSQQVTVAGGKTEKIDLSSRWDGVYVSCGIANLPAAEAPRMFFQNRLFPPGRLKRIEPGTPENPGWSHFSHPVTGPVVG